jgi:proteasome lid subunit RPN8/RPN11
MPDFAVVPSLMDSEPSQLAGLTLYAGEASAGYYDAEVFYPQTRALIQQLFREGRVEAGAQLEWSIVAREPSSSGRRFSARVRRSPYPFWPEPLPQLEPGGFAVEIEAAVLEALRKEVVAAGAIERAGLLVGRLLHDADRGAAMAHVTGKIDVEAGPGGASRAHFAIGPASFRSAIERARRRRDGTVLVGWGHTHPPCEHCVSTSGCVVDTVCFSGDDEEVHSVAFPSSYMLGLVAGKLGHLPATQPGFRLYGWEKGKVTERSFAVSGEIRG